MNALKVMNALRPGAQWSCNADDYEQLIWREPAISEGGQTKPTKEEWDAEWQRQEELEKLGEYRMQRMIEYPDFREYLDGIVKGDQEQIQAYIDACLAVKEKYPKPS